MSGCCESIPRQRHKEGCLTCVVYLQLELFDDSQVNMLEQGDDSSMAVVLWKPPGGIIDEILSRAGIQKRESTSGCDDVAEDAYHYDHDNHDDHDDHDDHDNHDNHDNHSQRYSLIYSPSHSLVDNNNSNVVDLNSLLIQSSRTFTGQVHIPLACGRGFLHARTVGPYLYSVNGTECCSVDVAAWGLSCLHLARARGRKVGEIEHSVGDDLLEAFYGHVDHLLSELHPTSKPFLQSPDVVDVVYVSPIRGQLDQRRQQAQSYLPKNIETKEQMEILQEAQDNV
uniref:Uncharacterized protein n=1 Tax=Timema bartmani TaxID=61472 RepID=A0A7R9EXJ2_9NEOP|nr:unnamed protein product [Timema bartmani]